MWTKDCRSVIRHSYLFCSKSFEARSELKIEIFKNVNFSRFSFTSFFNTVYENILKRFIFTGFSFDNTRRLRRSLKVVLFSLFLYWERVLLQSFVQTIWYLFHVLSNKGLHGPRSSLYWLFIYKKEFLKSIIRNTMFIMMYFIMCNNKKFITFRKRG